MRSKHLRKTALAVLFVLTVSLSGISTTAWAEELKPLAIAGVGTLELPDWLTATAAKGLEKQENVGLQFDLVGLSKDTWHYARLISYRMDQNLGMAAMLFGMAEANPQLLGELARPLIAKSLEENGGKVLEWLPVKKATLGGRSVSVLTARLIMTEKVPLPMYASVYVFMNKDKLSGLGLFCPDSDRQFWSPLFIQTANRLKWE